MIFTINKIVLLNNLQLLAKATHSRSTLPIVGCALFTQKNKTLNIRTTDLEITISLDLKVENDASGAVAIPMNKLLEITNAMPDGDINFSISDIGKVSINCDQGQYTIMGQPSEEFPAPYTIKNGTKFSIGSSELKNIIQNTTYATSKDDLKPVLQGVLFQINEDNLVSVATDGHRLVKFEKTGVQAPDYNGSVVVPTKFLSIINNQLEDENKTTIVIGENHIETNLINGTISSRIIKDPYPDYEGVIPKDNTKTLVVDKNLFSDAVKRVSIFSNKSSKQVSLNITEDSLTITTEDPENITSGKETLECNYDGEPMTIGYNASYLKEVLQHQNSNEIKIMLKSPLNAGLFLPIEQDENEKKTTLLMPIRLND